MALKRLLGCACIFSAGHLHTYEKKMRTKENNGILGGHYIFGTVL